MGKWVLVFPLALTLVAEINVLAMSRAGVVCEADVGSARHQSLLLIHTAQIPPTRNTSTDTGSQNPQKSLAISTSRC